MPCTADSVSVASLTPDHTFDPYAICALQATLQSMAAAVMLRLCILVLWRAGETVQTQSLAAAAPFCAGQEPDNAAATVSYCDPSVAQ